MTDTLPLPRPRPAFDGWLRLVSRDYAWAGQKLKRSREYIRRLCLPFDDPNRAKPGGGLVEEIARLTSGAVTGDDWHLPAAELIRDRAA